MSFNILGGGGERLPKIYAIIRQENPDFLAIQEANGFDKNNNQQMQSFAHALGFPHYVLSLAPSGYHVASWSKCPFVSVNTFATQFRNAAVQTVLRMPFGDMAICNTHLSPWTEQERVQEIAVLIQAQKSYPYHMILGDLNSLAPHDIYSNADLHKFNEYQKTKFMQNGKLCFAVITALTNAGYRDVAKKQGSAAIKTVHKGTQERYAHSTELRLDYIFVSAPLGKRVQEMHVLVNADTRSASDHYPVIATMGIE